MTFEKALVCTDEIMNSIIKYDDSIDYQLTTDDCDWIYKAREALEKQIPKKPKYEKVIEGIEYWYCPTCGEVVLAKLKNAPIENEYNHNHCGRCGQAIDWSEEE